MTINLMSIELTVGNYRRRNY